MRPLATIANQPPFDARGSSGARGLRVLVVVPTLNEEKHIAALLESLINDVKALPQGTTGQIAVVDGGSDDRTVELSRAREHAGDPVVILNNPRRIQSAAMNLAARCLGRDTDVLIRCDAHAQYPADFCRRLLVTLEQEQADAVVVPMDSVGDGPLQKAIACVSNSLIGTGGSAHRGGARSGFVDHGHHAAFRMNRFRTTGGYDEGYSHNEDAEYDCRQRALGAKIFLDASIRVKYRPRSTLKALCRQYFNYGAGRARTVRRHPGTIRLRQFLVPAHVLISGVSVLVSPWFPAILLWPASYVTVVSVTSAYLGIREQSLSTAIIAAPAACAMHLSWGTGFLSSLRHPEARWRPAMARPLWDQGRPGAASRNQQTSDMPEMAG